MSNFLNRIPEKMNSLSRNQQIVASYIMENLENVAFDTLKELANKINVSTTTIIRFARELGYFGYSDMQKDIQRNIIHKSSLPERLNHSKSISKNELMKETFQNDIKNIEDTMSFLSENSINDTIESICTANQVYVLGLRSSYSLAHYITSRLAQIRKNVKLVQATGMIYPEEIVSAGKGDICLAFLFPRYSKTTTTLLSWLKAYNVKIILFTSLNYSIVEGYGDVVLPCAVSGISYKNSFAAPLCLINYIANACALRSPEKSKKILKQTEEILSQGFYLGI
jgi:DNA-binding MurR/RpiR family transcriptional regulator